MTKCLSFLVAFFALCFFFVSAPNAHAASPDYQKSVDCQGANQVCNLGSAAQGADIAPGYACGSSNYVYSSTTTGGVISCNSDINSYCCEPGTPKTPLPPHNGYQLNHGCGPTSICYTDHNGDTKSAKAGLQCGQLSGWVFGTKGNGSTDSPSCGINALCCDVGTGPAATPIPPNPCPSDNGVCKSIPTALGTIDVTDPGAFIKTIFAVLLSLSGGIALLLIIISGYRIMTAQGDPEKVKGAREMLTSAIIGLLFMIFSVSILQILGVDLLHLPGFGQ